MFGLHSKYKTIYEIINEIVTPVKNLQISVSQQAKSLNFYQKCDKQDRCSINETFSHSHSVVRPTWLQNTLFHVFYCSTGNTQGLCDFFFYPSLGLFILKMYGSRSYQVFGVKGSINLHKVVHLSLKSIWGGTFILTNTDNEHHSSLCMTILLMIHIKGTAGHHTLRSLQGLCKIYSL